MVTPSQVHTVPFTSDIAFGIGRATDRVSEDGRTAGSIIGRDESAVAELIPGKWHVNPGNQAILWSLKFQPSRLVFGEDCIRMYGQRTNDNNLRAIVIPRRFAEGVSCIQTYEE